ncbi:MAG: hypothetical protein KJO51_00265, partial [Gramella sp.]|nr:hypothetical protein [Christiangramia sp.]
MMAVFFMNTTSLVAQKGNAANFSIYGDLYSGTPIQSIASDDWFKGVTANGMIDESETANFTTITNSKSNQAFTARSPYNQYKELNGFLLYDAIFGRDHVNFGSKWGGRDKSAFLGSSGKNTDNPLNTWDLGTDETVASANDLVDIYAHLRRAGITVGTNMWLTLGVSTISNSGDHYVDFELYKSPITFNGSRTKFINSGPDATGGHSAWSLDAQGNVTTSGDMIAAFEFNGTSVSNVTLRVWTHHDTWKNITPQNFNWGTFIEGENNYGYAEIIIPNGGVYSSGSTSNIPGPPWGTFYDNATDPVTGTYRPGYFVEVGINLSSLGIDPSLDSGNPCDAPFTKLMVKSRSSSSFTSTLKDFAGPYNFLGSSVVDTEIAKSPDIFDSCSSNTITLSPLNPQTGAYYSWTTVDGEFSNGAKTYIGETAIATKPGTYILAAAPLEGCTESTNSIRLYASPCAVDDIAEVVENNGAVVIDILANDFDLDDDIDPTSVKNASLLKPVNGSVSINPSTGQMTYTPNPDFYGVE